MPPVRIRERGRAKKGTMKRLLKQLFKLYPWHLVLVLVCLVFNVFGNISSSIFVSLTTNALVASGEMTYAGTPVNPFVDTYDVVSTFGFTMHTNITSLLIILGCIYFVGIFASWGWNRTMAIVTQSFMNDFRKRMFDHMQDLPEMTKIVIAQRISSIEDADQIIIMDDGKIVYIGNHDKLLKTSKIYQEVYYTQNRVGGDK